MVTKEQIDALEQAAYGYANAAGKVSFEIENRQEELTGVLEAYQDMNTASAQILRQYFLKGGVL